MTYSVFTRDHDEIVDAGTLVETLEEGELERFEAYLPEILKTYDGERPPMTALEDGPKLVILLDCSGSMRGAPIWAAVSALLAAGDALDAAGRDFEILGYTSKSWKGGEPRQEWRKAGCEPNPGRLNALRHILFKTMDQSWEVGRRNLHVVLREAITKEDVPGEALEWAESRILERGAPGDEVLVFLSDGAAVCDSTLTANDTNILEEHLAEVAARLEDPDAEMGFYQIPHCPDNRLSRVDNRAAHINHYHAALAEVVSIDHDVKAPEPDSEEMSL